MNATARVIMHSTRRKHDQKSGPFLPRKQFHRSDISIARCRKKAFSVSGPVIVMGVTTLMAKKAAKKGTKKAAKKGTKKAAKKKK